MQIVNLIQKMNEEGKLYLLNLDSMQIVAGTSRPILQFPGDHLPHAKDPHLDNIRRFLADHNLDIILPNAWIPTKQRRNDKILMDEVQKHYGRHNKMIDQYNQCRLFLKVLYLSDLTTGDGTKVHPRILQDRTAMKSGRTHLKFPTQPNPPEEAWHNW